MVDITRKATTERAIEDYIAPMEPQRPYLGMSSLGEPCSRKLWYGFHWCSQKPIQARVKRIFERGHIEEERIITDLKKVGCEVYRRDKEGNHIELFGKVDEEQQEIIGFAGHVKGHTDGEILGIIESPKTPHLAEFKTANDKGFKNFVKNKVKVANYKYYVQMQVYMHYLKLKRAFFVVTNKNDESRYYERVHYCDATAEEHISKSQSIVMSPYPPKREFQRSWYACKWCNFFEICHDGKEVDKNCRTCKHHDICDDGVWECNFYKTKLTTEHQRNGKDCPNWTNDPDFYR